MSRETIIERLNEDQRQWVEDLFRENERLSNELSALVSTTIEVRQQLRAAEAVVAAARRYFYSMTKENYAALGIALRDCGTPPEGET